MGYELHITRKENWFDEDTTNDISMDQWNDYVKEDSELRMDNFAEASTTQGEVIRIEHDGICVWTKYSKDGRGGNHAWFWLSQGSICAKNPDAEIRNKMLDIAERLNAKVQGDDGEFYVIREVVRHEPWWKLWS